MYESETQSDTRANRIDPVLAASGWMTVPGTKVQREMICPGRIMPGGKHGDRLSPDYILIHRDHKLASIEAKRAGLPHTTGGLARAKDNATQLKARLAYATKGLDWYEADMATGAEADVQPFPTPDQLWDRCFGDANKWLERFGAVPFELADGKWEQRYYQHNAINSVLEGVGKRGKRISLTLATGTGKTSIAFQIAWKLFHARWNLSNEPTRRPRILFLANRNILADQAYTGALSV